jgi:hypothetical protein
MGAEQTCTRSSLCVRFPPQQTSGQLPPRSHERPLWMSNDSSAERPQPRIILRRKSRQNARRTDYSHSS